MCYHFITYYHRNWRKKRFNKPDYVLCMDVAPKLKFTSIKTNKSTFTGTKKSTLEERRSYNYVTSIL